uniref:Uncharacterized protein n=1 Tax=Wuchereria bancrofti TaxID=6293 RepID=A0AAF5Q0Q6_WUCBA
MRTISIDCSLSHSKIFFNFILLRRGNVIICATCVWKGLGTLSTKNHQ